MERLKTLEAYVTLLFLACCFLCHFINNPLFPPLSAHFHYDILSVLANTNRSIFVIIVFAIVLFFGVRAIRKYFFAFKEQGYHLFDNIPTPACIVSPDSNRFLFVNKAWLECFGYLKKEVFSMVLSDIVSSEEWTLEENGLGFKDGNPKPKPVRQKKKCGEFLTSEIATSRVTFKGRECIMLISLNIEPAGNALSQKETVEKEINLEPIVENFPVDVAIFDKDHRYLLLNKTAVRDDAMRKWMIGKDDFEYFARKGTDMTVAKKRRERFHQAIDGITTEWIDEHLVDGKVKYVLRKFFPYKEDGKLKYVYGYGLDITQLRKAQLDREEYMEQLEKIAFATSHEIRQPICNLKGLLSVLEMEKDPSDAITEIIGGMNQSVVILDEFTKDLAIKLHDFKQDLSAKNNES